MAISAHGLTVKLFLQLAVILAACRLCGWHRAPLAWARPRW